MAIRYMHELSIASDILEIIKPKVLKPEELLKVGVSANSLSGINYSSLTFCFNELCKINGFTNASLDIFETQIKKKCMQCNNEFECIIVDTNCPSCGSIYCKLISDSPFKIDYIEIEEQDNV